MLSCRALRERGEAFRALAFAVSLTVPAGAFAQEALTSGWGVFREIETENIFGFTAGTDIGAEGETEVSAQTAGRFGKRGGSYRSFEHKLSIEHTPTQFMQVELGLIGASHAVRDVPGLADRDRSTFGGVSGEVRYLVIGRGPGSPIGLTASFEPTFAWIDDTTGERLRRIEAEFKLSADTELVPDRLYAALNAIYEPEWVHPRLEATERETGVGLSAALAYRLTPKLTLGGEVRYLRKYEGVDLKRFEGEALYVGPTLHLQLTRKTFLAAGWLTQVAGRQATDRRERAVSIAEAVETGQDPLIGVPVRPRGLNLSHFERHQTRLKLAVEF